MGIRRVTIVALAIGTGAGLLTASVMTLLDWRLNPGGIFHDSNGTDWGVLGETALSWFVPVAALVSAVSLPLLFWLGRRS